MNLEIVGIPAAAALVECSFQPGYLSVVRSAKFAADCWKWEWWCIAAGLHCSEIERVLHCCLQ